MEDNSKLGSLPGAHFGNPHMFWPSGVDDGGCTECPSHHMLPHELFEITECRSISLHTHNAYRNQQRNLLGRSILGKFTIQEHLLSIHAPALPIQYCVALHCICIVLYRKLRIKNMLRPFASLHVAGSHQCFNEWRAYEGDADACVRVAREAF